MHDDFTRLERSLSKSPDLISNCFLLREKSREIPIYLCCTIQLKVNDQGRLPLRKRPCCKKYRPISRVLFPLCERIANGFRHLSSPNIAIRIKQPTHYDNHRSERQRAVVRS